MTLELQSNQNYTLTLAPRSTKTVEIIRAESELQAIDELMADLAEDFVAEANLTRDRK